MTANPWLATFLDDPGPNDANDAKDPIDMGRGATTGPGRMGGRQGRLAEAEPPAGVLPSLWRARVKVGLAFARDWG